MTIEAQWAELYARGVCPREVAFAVDYCYGGESSRWDSGNVSAALRTVMEQRGIVIESVADWRARVTQK